MCRPQELQAERTESAASRDAARRAVEMLSAKEAEWQEQLSTALVEVAEKVEQEALIREALFKYKMETLDAVISLERESAGEADRKMRDTAGMAVALSEVATKVEAEAAVTQGKLQLLERANANLKAYGPSADCAVEFVVSAPAGAAGVLLVGNATVLGGWDKARGVPMSQGASGEWRCAVPLASARVYAYKYLIIDAEGNVAEVPAQESILSIRSEEGTLQVLDEWGAPQRGRVLSEAGSELRQDRLAALLAEIVAEAIPPSSSSVGLSR